MNEFLSSFISALLFQGGYTATLVTLSTTILGICAGFVGAFAVLRKQAMVSDAMSHGMLPGVAAAFLFSVLLGYQEKSLPILLLGGGITGILSVLAISWFKRLPGINDDTAIAISLSFFFGIGILLLSIVQGLSVGSQGGLSHFIFGQTASISEKEAYWIGILGLSALILFFSFIKELRLVAFDEQFAGASGFSPQLLDAVLFFGILLISLLGLPSVGLIMVVASLTIPAVSALLWAHTLPRVLLLSSLFGGLNGWIGSAISASGVNLPTGAVIVVTAGVFFLLSFLFAPKKGVLSLFLTTFVSRLRIHYEHILRGMYEYCETYKKQSVPTDWFKKSSRTKNIFAQIAFLKLKIERSILATPNGYEFSELGEKYALKITQAHRMWEEYLLRYASFAPGHVDRIADFVEHIRSDSVRRELEQSLKDKGSFLDSNNLTKSVHPIKVQE